MSRPGETIAGHRDLHRGGDQGTVFRHGLPTMSVPPMSNNISHPSTSSYPPANARQRPQPPNRSHTSSESPPPDPEPSGATIATQPITADMDHDGIDQDDSKLELKMKARSIRFGTYRVSDTLCTVSADGLMVSVPTETNQDIISSSLRPRIPRASVAFLISYRHLTSVSATFSPSVCALFLRVSPSCAKTIRTNLMMNYTLDDTLRDLQLPYFDPKSPKTEHRCLTVILDMNAKAAANSPMKQRLIRFFCNVVEPKIVDTRQPNNTEPLFKLLGDEEGWLTLQETLPPTARTEIDSQQSLPVVPLKVHSHPPVAARIPSSYALHTSALIDPRYAILPQYQPQTRQLYHQYNSSSQQPIAGGAWLPPGCSLVERDGHRVAMIQSSYVPNSPQQRIMTRSRTGGVPSSRKQGSTSMVFGRQAQRRQQQRQGQAEVIHLLDDDDDEEKTKSVAAAANGDDTLEPQSKVARRADTDASDSTKRQTEQKGDSDDAKGGTVLLVYPKEKKGAVTVHRNDLLTLADGEFLNDTAIDIYLKYLLHERLPESVRDKVFVFTTFFWSRLTSKSQTNDRHGPVSLPADAPTTKRQVESIARYNAVKSWTKDVDLFSKDFIVVPINWQNHWFLVIMCYAGYVNDSGDNKGTLKKPSTPNAPSPSNSNETPPQPCIVLFDSLNPRASGPGSGGSVGYHYGAVTTLRDYLSMEWLHRHHDKRLKVFDKNYMKAHYPKCPQQSNYWDCGVFLLHYAEKFLSDPPRIFTMKAYDSQWFAESEVTEKRQLIRKLIRNLSDEYYTQRQKQPLSDAAFALPDDAKRRELETKIEKWESHCRKMDYGHVRNSRRRSLSPHTTFGGMSEEANGRRRRYSVGGKSPHSFFSTRPSAVTPPPHIDHSSACAFTQ